MAKGDNFRGKKPINTPKGPSTQVEVEFRINEVCTLFIQKYSRGEIVSIMKDKYGISPQQVDKYIKTVKERIREKGEQNMDYEFALVNAQIDDFYKCARKENQRVAVARALKLKIDLNGLAIPLRKEVASGLIINEEDLEEYGDDNLTPEEKKMIQGITGLSE